MLCNHVERLDVFSCKVMKSWMARLDHSRGVAMRAWAAAYMWLGSLKPRMAVVLSGSPAGSWSMPQQLPYIIGTKSMPDACKDSCDCFRMLIMWQLLLVHCWPSQIMTFPEIADGGPVLSQ